MLYNFYHITDVHYYSKRNIACDYTKLPQPSTQICILKSEEAFKKALAIVENDPDTNTAIITGDLTNHGDANSHDETKELLQDFTLRGGNPYVVTDTHDYPWFEIFNINEKGEKIPSEHLTEEAVIPMYYPYGRDKGFDSYDDSTTYIAEILPGLYYIAFGYELTSEDGKNTPRFPDKLMDWAKKHIADINEKGGTVICGTHWPIVSPSPAYSVVGKGNTFVNGEDFAKELADLGVKLFFSGHTHIQCIKEITSCKGNKLYSVQTSSLSGFPPKMRKITIDTDNKTIDVKTIDLDLPDLGDAPKFTEYARKGFLGIIESVPYNMEHDVEAFANTEGGVNLPKELILKHPKTVMYLGRKLNGLNYGKVAKFSRKHHGMTEKDYVDVSDRKYITLLFDLVANLYRGNATYTPDTVEYKITMGRIKKIEKALSVLHIDVKKLLCGYSLSEFVEPLLYNKGLDADSLHINY